MSKKATAVQEKPEQEKKGKYLIVAMTRKDGELGSIGYNSPSPDYKDIVLTAWQETVIDPFWLDVPDFERDIQSERIVVRWDDRLPVRTRLEPDSDLARNLTPTEVQMVKTICELPINAQIRSALRVDLLIGETGIPGRDVQVTVNFLKRRHAPFLRAVEELEKRWQKRPEVLKEVRAALDRIASF